ncbi:unnamed protein product, partial [Ectocarpus fasciculatus]
MSSAHDPSLLARTHRRHTFSLCNLGMYKQTCPSTHPCFPSHLSYPWYEAPRLRTYLTKPSPRRLWGRKRVATLTRGGKTTRAAYVSRVRVLRGFESRLQSKSRLRTKNKNTCHADRPPSPPPSRGEFDQPMRCNLPSRYATNLKTGREGKRDPENRRVNPVRAVAATHVSVENRTRKRTGRLPGCSRKKKRKDKTH